MCGGRKASCRPATKTTFVIIQIYGWKYIPTDIIIKIYNEAHYFKFEYISIHGAVSAASREPRCLPVIAWNGTASCGENVTKLPAAPAKASSCDVSGLDLRESFFCRLVTRAVRRRRIDAFYSSILRKRNKLPIRNLASYVKLALIHWNRIRIRRMLYRVNW